MQLLDAQWAFLAKNHSAAMTSLGRDGTPHAVRVGVAVVDGKIWSSGVPGRARTKHLQRDARSTLFVFEQGFAYLTLECRVSILTEQGAENNLRLFDVMQASRPDKSVLMWNGKPLAHDAFRQAMVDEQRLIYEFAPLRAYGLQST